MRAVWNHNNHYHDLLLGQIPRAATRVLDIGCGYGFLARRLAEDRLQVDAIDVDQHVIDVAQKLQGDRAGLHFRCSDFLSLGAADDTFDALTCVAGLHHMPFEEALAQMKRLLRPGGTLAVLGLFRMASPADYAVGAVAFLVSRILSLLHDPRRERLLNEPPLRDPQMTLAEIRETAKKLLPGVRIRRLLLWRYLLVWRKPAQIDVTR